MSHEFQFNAPSMQQLLPHAINFYFVFQQDVYPLCFLDTRSSSARIFSQNSIQIQNQEDKRVNDNLTISFLLLLVSILRHSYEYLSINKNIILYSLFFIRVN